MAEAEGSAVFTIDFDATASTKSAEESADALERLSKEMRKQQDIVRALKSGGDESVAQAKVHKENIALLKGAIEKENLALAKQGTTVKEVNARRKEAAAAEKAAAAKAKENSASVVKAAVVQKKSALESAAANGELVKSAQAISSMMPLEAKAIMAAAAATWGLIAAVGAFVIHAADARRSELLHLEGLTKMRNWYGIAAGSATELQSAIDRVSASSATSRDKVAGYAEQLYKAGLRGNNLSEALDAMAIKASTQGEEAAQAWKGWAIGAGLAGGSVKRLADDVRARLGGIAQKQLLSLDVQWMKFKENLQGFGKVFNIEPILRGLNVVLSMFKEGAAASDAWRAILDAIFGPIFGKGEEGGKRIKKIVQGTTIAVLNMATAAYDASAALGDAMPDWVKKKWEGFGDTITTVKYAAMGLGAEFAFLQFLTNPLARTAALFTVVSVAVSNTKKAMSDLVDFVKGFGWANLGEAIVTGIADGISSAAKGAVDGVKNLASDLKNGFKGALGIRSPSRVFAQFGAYTVQGFSQGVRAETPSAREPLERMAETPSAREPLERMAAPPSTSSYSATTTNSSRSVVIQNLNVTAGSQGAAQALRDEIARVLEGVALEMGGARV